MKRAALFFLAAGLATVSAQSPATKPVRTDASTAFAIAVPDENSPFFMDPAAAKTTSEVSYAGRDLKDTIAEYPLGRDSEGSAAAQVKGFFTGIFAGVNLGPIRTAPTTAKLEVDPEKFSLEDRREINVTYTIRNNTKKLTRLEYPSTQRIDMITRDGKGEVIDRWSDDRSFQPEEGIVVINPKERIEYQEKIPTREMKSGESYRIESFTTGEEKFTTEKTVTPR